MSARPSPAGVVEFAKYIAIGVAAFFVMYGVTAAIGAGLFFAAAQIAERWPS